MTAAEMVASRLLASSLAPFYSTACTVVIGRETEGYGDLRDDLVRQSGAKGQGTTVSLGMAGMAGRTGATPDDGRTMAMAAHA